MPDTIGKMGHFASLKGKCSPEEWEVRVNLAAAYRMGYHLGWNNTIRNHISARVPGHPDQFLLNPLGLGWNEITASSLVKTDMDKNILDDTEYGLADAGYNFHSKILAAKPELDCVYHTHPKVGIAVGALEEGLMFLDQGGLYLYGKVAYHKFEGIAFEEDEGPRIVADLGDNEAMIMCNHGLLTVGRTVPEAFLRMNSLIEACDTQVRVMSMGGTIRPIPKEICEFTRKQSTERRSNKPRGDDEWPMYLRLAEKLDPSFAT